MIKEILFTILAVLILAAAAADPAGAQQRFGTSILVSQDHIFVGEPDNLYRPGTVYTFASIAGEWKAAGEIVSPDPEMGDHFGRSLSMDGDRLLIGSTGVEDSVGAAYIFERSDDGTWGHSATLDVSDAVANDGYGAAVALDGDYAFVGAPSTRENPGSVYVFGRAANGSWSQVDKLTGSESEANAGFGRSIIVSDSTAFIGAPGEANNSGAVYAFEHDGEAWSESTRLRARAISSGARLGSALDLDGGMLLAGAPRHGGNVGAAILFEKDAESGQWIESALLQPYASTGFHSFGTSVAIDDDDVLIGSPLALSNAGAVYAFRHDDGEWSDVTRLSSDERAERDLLGSSLDLRDSAAAVGLAGSDYGAGSVMIFTRSGSDWTQTALLKSEASGLAPVVGAKVDCAEGTAALFACEQVDLLSFLPIADIGGNRGVNLNDIWGWTDSETGREYALVGRVDGTSFVDITDPLNPLYIGDLPRTEGSPGSSWRDIKVYKDHAFIVADGAGEHGVQVFDLTLLRDVEELPATFNETVLYDRINSAHNIVIDTESGFAYAVGNSSGGETCGGGLHMIDIQDPRTPTFAGCFSDTSTGRAGTGYSHDAQCLVYRGPDTDYNGRQICFGSNETALSIADVTDKSNPVSIASAAYPNVSYTHQGWISEDHRYFYVNDELDEISGNVPETRTLIWDITELEDPQLVKEYMWGNESSDHNLYIRGNLMYQSNYASGLHIHDITDPENPVEVGHFDTMPVGDNGPGFAGSWSNYPFFESGTIAVSSIGEGLFLLRKTETPGL
jgi:choice-of-anchor B domain-containing protein